MDGAARVDPLFQAPDPARVSGAGVTFEPRARTAGHTASTSKRDPRIDVLRGLALLMIFVDAGYPTWRVISAGAVFVSFAMLQKGWIRSAHDAQSFDRVFSSYFYCHLEEPERLRFLAEARRVAPGLVLVGTVLRNGEEPARWEERDSARI